MHTQINNESLNVFVPRERYITINNYGITCSHALWETAQSSYITCIIRFQTHL